MGLYVLKYPARRALEPLARILAPVHPDVLSYLATGATVATALCYLNAADKPALLLWAIGLTLLRMALNTLDGVLALARGKLSLAGEIVNALPDRYSDVLLVGGIALSGLCRPALGVLALASMLLVSYAGMLGKAVGVDWQHQGPLGKVERLLLVMALSLVQFVLLAGGATGWNVAGLHVTPLELCMALFVLLGQATVFGRTRGMLRQIARLEWRKARPQQAPPGRVLVAYDSTTGNTEKVAAAIADCLQADLARVDEAERALSQRPGDYELVVVGTPVTGGAPSAKVLAFLQSHPDLNRYALFMTYGAPIWGPISVRKCVRRVCRIMMAAPVGVFTCKGRHATIRTYRSHPNEADLLKAFAFGIRLARGRGDCFAVW